MSELLADIYSVQCLMDENDRRGELPSPLSLQPVPIAKLDCSLGKQPLTGSLVS